MLRRAETGETLLVLLLLLVLLCALNQQTPDNTGRRSGVGLQAHVSLCFANLLFLLGDAHVQQQGVLLPHQ
jgi:hypothetical protein